MRGIADGERRSRVVIVIDGRIATGVRPAEFHGRPGFSSGGVDHLCHHELFDGFAALGGDGDIDLKPAPYFRKEFEIGNKIRKATAYIAAAGLFELYLNGDRVGDHQLDPTYTRIDRRNLYVTHDVTEFLHNGQNAMGVILGNGWYSNDAGVLGKWVVGSQSFADRPILLLKMDIETVNKV